MINVLDGEEEGKDITNFCKPILILEFNFDFVGDVDDEDFDFFDFVDEVLVSMLLNKVDVVEVVDVVVVAIDEGKSFNHLTTISQIPIPTKTTILQVHPSHQLLQPIKSKKYGKKRTLV